MSSPRLTRKEWEMVWSCLAFVDAGEIDGGPIEGETEKDTDARHAVFKSAMDKVRQRQF